MPEWTHRASFNTLVDLWDCNTLFPEAFVYAASVPARLVVSRSIERHALVVQSSRLYMTTAVNVPYLAPASPMMGFPSQYFVVYNRGDQVASVAGGPRTHYVIAYDVIHGGTGVIYYRWDLRELPLPP